MLPEFLKQIFVLLKASLIGRLIGAVSSIVLARVLGANAFGGYTLFLQLIQTAESTSKLGIEYSLAYYLSTDRDLREQLSKHLVFSAIRLGLICATAASLVAAILISSGVNLLGLLGSDNRYLLLGAITSCVLIECAGSFLWDMTYARGNIRDLSMRYSVFGPIKAAMALVGAITGGLYWSIYGWLGGSCIQLAWLGKNNADLAKVYVEGRGKGRLGVSKLLRKGLPFYASNLAGQLVLYPLLLSLSGASGESSVSMVRVGQIVAQIFAIFSGAVVPVLFQKLRASGKDAGTSVLGLAFSGTLGISLVGYALLFLLNAPIIEYVFGAEYIGSMEATRVLVACTIVDSLCQIMMQPVLSNGKSVTVAIAFNTAAAVSELVGFMLIPVLGQSGFLLSRLVYSVLPFLSLSVLASQEIQNYKVGAVEAFGCVNIVLLGLVSVFPNISANEILSSWPGFFLMGTGFLVLRNRSDGLRNLQ